MEQTPNSAERIAILGAGISGLSVGWLLSKLGKTASVFEASDRIGGLARTFEWHGIPCDVAPHRLYTTNQEILRLVSNLVPLTEHKRKSRILMKGKRIQDPINPIELLMRFPLRTGAALVWGFLRRPKLPEDSFESLALNRYGKGLYDFFFDPYTTKMFGVAPADISVIWGREKLRSSGLLDTIKRNSKTFFSSFHYPQQGGYGTIADAMAVPLREHLHLQSPVTGLEWTDGRITAVKYRQDGAEQRFPCDRVFSTIPATILASMLGESLKLRFRPIQLVYLNIAKPEVMPYHWVYFGDGDVVINRMAEFKHFHTNLEALDSTVLCAEVTAETDDPVGDVMKALKTYSLVSEEDVKDVLVLPERFGYPVYDRDFELATEKAERLFSAFSNLHRVGRNAEFRHIELDEDLESALVQVKGIYGLDDLPL